MKNRSTAPRREDTRRALTRSTGARVITYLNKSRLHEPLEKPAAKKIFAANEAREATCRALHVKRRATARAKQKLK